MKYDGAKNFEDGSLNDIANVRLIFQGIEGKLCIATLDASSKEWKYPTVGVDPASLPDMLRGGSLTACITKSDNDSNKDIFSVFYQDAKDATLKEYRLDFSSGEPAPKMTNGSKIFANATSIGAGVLAFMDGVVPALVALTHSNAIVSVTAKDKDSPDKGWNDPKSVTDGTKSAGLAAMAWPGDSGPCNRVYAHYHPSRRSGNYVGTQPQQNGSLLNRLLRAHNVIRRASRKG